jgi:transposase
VPRDHPLRPLRTPVHQTLTVLSPAFDQLYVDIGRPSAPPEKLLRVVVLQALCSVRSERQPMEQLEYNLLFRRSLLQPIEQYERILVTIACRHTVVRRLMIVPRVGAVTAVAFVAAVDCPTRFSRTRSGNQHGTAHTIQCHADAGPSSRAISASPSGSPSPPAARSENLLGQDS